MGKSDRTNAGRALREKVDAENEAKANAPFERSAAFYDAMHAEMNHSAWAKRYASHLGNAPHGVIDWGCRTGQNAAQLTKLGYRVTGVEPCGGLVRQAKERGVDALLGSPLASPLHEGRKFDAALCVNFSLGYWSLSNEALIRTLRAIRSHLLRGSRFVFDFLHAPFAAAAGKHYPEPSEFGDATMRHMRDYDAGRSLVTITLDFTTPSGEFREVHHVRAFSAPEIRLALFMANFKTIDVFAPHADHGPEFDNTIWTCDPVLLAVAEAA